MSTEGNAPTLNVVFRAPITGLDSEGHQHPVSPGTYPIVEVGDEAATWVVFSHPEHGNIMADLIN